MIRGEYYGIITQDDIDEECYYLATRAIAAFKFPRISTDYETFYAKRDPETGDLEEVDAFVEGAIPHGQFKNDLTQAEIEIIMAWMKVYWCEKQISNSDNFENLYTDANIKTFSRANAMAQHLKMLETYRNYARDLENRYSRVSALRKPTVGDINE